MKVDVEVVENPVVVGIDVGRDHAAMVVGDVQLDGSIRIIEVVEGNAAVLRFLEESGDENLRDV